MKTLLLMRHSKTQKAGDGHTDLDRHLDPVGRADARRMAELLSGKGIRPDVVVCSNAVRAVETAKIVSEVFGLNQTPLDTPQLYDAGPGDFLDALDSLDDMDTSVLMIAHNPTIEEFLRKYSGYGLEVRTSDVLRFDLDIKSWTELRSISRLKFSEKYSLNV